MRRSGKAVLNADPLRENTDCCIKESEVLSIPAWAASVKKQDRVMKRHGLVGVLLFVSSLAVADSITIYGSNEFRKPVLLTTDTTPFIAAFKNFPDPLTSALYFKETFAQGQIITSLSWTLATLNSSYVLTFAPQTCMTATCSLFGNFVLPRFPHQHEPRNATLTVDLNGRKETFGFTWATVIPEPSSFLLLGTGLAVIGWWKFRSIGTANHY